MFHSSISRRKQHELRRHCIVELRSDHKAAAVYAIILGAFVVQTIRLSQLQSCAK